MNQGATKAMWLYLYRAKRRVKGSELARHINTDPSAIHAMLKSMRLAGSIVKHGDTIEFEVTPKCSVPHGVLLEELAC